jgi:hypothetical protein
MVYSADFGSILFQIFMIWLFSTLFSKKKKGKKNASSIISKLYEKFISFIENKFDELDIISEDLNHSPEMVPPEKISIEKSTQRKIHQDLIHKNKKTNLKTKLGLNSKSKIKDAIIVNEILSKPLSLRK